jgi:hypothetical protein
MKKPGIAKVIPSQNNAEVIKIQNFKLYYRVIVSKRAQY